MMLMLVQFNVGNFLSFNEIQSLRMTKSNDEGEIFINSAFIYGPNAAGKSNFIEALRFTKRAIVNGSIPKDNYSFFYNKQDPSYFEYIIELQGSRYSYGFEYDFNNKYYQSEWLHQLKDSGDDVIFEWSYKGEAPHYNPNDCEFTSSIDGFSLDVPDFIDTDLFLKNGVSLDPRIELVYTWFDVGLTVKTADDVFNSTVVPDDYIDFLKDNLKKLSICFDDVILKPFVGQIDSNSVDSLYFNIPNTVTYFRSSSYLDAVVLTKRENNELKHYELLLSHKGAPEGSYRLADESTGTIRIIQLLTFLSKQKLYSSGLLAIDEVECSLHPIVLEAYLDMLKSPEYENTQIVLTTHEKTLLQQKYAGIDNVWFIRMNDAKKGSKLYSLRSFGSKIQNYDQLYLDGKFSATPLFTDFDLEDE